MVALPSSASSAATRASMLANRGVDTAPEVTLRRELHRRRLCFRKHRRPLPGVRCTADIVFTGARVAVFVDGCYWHRCPRHATSPATNAEFWKAKFERNVARDRRNDAALAAAGWTVVRIWEHEVDASIAAAADRICAALAGTRTTRVVAERPPAR